MKAVDLVQDDLSLHIIALFIMILFLHVPGCVSLYCYTRKFCVTVLMFIYR